MVALTHIRAASLIALAGLLVACGGSSSSNRNPTNGGDSAAPTLNLSTSSTSIRSGDTVQLSWNSSNTTSCNASGGWSGSRGTAGSATVGPLTTQTTFTLNCTGSRGTALNMVTISVNGTMSLNWVAPTENADGSNLTDLDGYRVYYGQSPRNYTNNTDVDDPSATSANIALPPGDYFVAMTALDREGNESAYSNEVAKTVF